MLSALEAEMVFIRNLIGGLLAELEDDIDRDRFKRFLTKTPYRQFLHCHSLTRALRRLHMRSTRLAHALQLEVRRVSDRASVVILREGSGKVSISRLGDSKVRLEIETELECSLTHLLLDDNLVRRNINRAISDNMVRLVTHGWSLTAC